MSARALKIAAGVLSVGTPCWVADSVAIRAKRKSWRKSAEAEFWRPSHSPPAAGIPSDTKLFIPRMDFPSTVETPSAQPWRDVDFVGQPREYLYCLLRTCLDSNVERDFDMSDKEEKVW